MHAAKQPLKLSIKTGRRGRPPKTPQQGAVEQRVSADWMKHDPAIYQGKRPNELQLLEDKELWLVRPTDVWTSSQLTRVLAGLAGQPAAVSRRDGNADRPNIRKVTD